MAGQVFDPAAFFGAPKAAPTPVPVQPGPGVGAPPPTVPATAQVAAQEQPVAPAPPVVTAPPPATTPGTGAGPMPPFVPFPQAPAMPSPAIFPGQAMAPVQAPVQAPQPQAPGPGEDDVNPTGKQLAFGQKISRYPVPKFRGVTGFNRRIAILSTDEMYFAKTHYEQGMGHFFCFEGICCDYGDPNVRYLFPILVYDTDKDGNIVSPKFSIEYLAAAEANYENLLMLNRALPLNSIDIIVLCTDDKFQKVGFQPACQSGQAAWLQNAQFRDAVWAKYQSLKRHILRGHARRLGSNQAEAEETYRRLSTKTSGTQVPGAAAGAFNLNQFMNQAHPGGGGPPVGPPR